MTLIDILTIILLVLASVVCIALIVGLKKIIQSVSMLQADVQEMKTSIKPLISSVQEVTEKLNYISNETKSQIQMAKSVVQDVRTRVDQILSLEKKVRGSVEDVVIPLTENLTAVSKGFDAFWRKLRNK